MSIIYIPIFISSYIFIRNVSSWYGEIYLQLHYSGDWDRHISVNLRPPWSTYRVSGQPGLHIETTSQQRFGPLGCSVCNPSTRERKLGDLEVRVILSYITTWRLAWAAWILPGSCLDLLTWRICHVPRVLPKPSCFWLAPCSSGPGVPSPHPNTYQAPSGWCWHSCCLRGTWQTDIHRRLHLQHVSGTWPEMRSVNLCPAWKPRTAPSLGPWCWAPSWDGRQPR